MQNLQDHPNFPFNRNHHHFNRYIRFITKRITRKPPIGKVEIHHIVPKSFWKENDDQKDNKDNLIVLTLREHYVAHMILSKAFPEIKMIYAFWQMSHDGKHEVRLTSRQYENLKKDFKRIRSESLKGQKNHMYGRNDQCYGPRGIATLGKKLRGLTYEEIHGEEKAREIKLLQSFKRAGVPKSKEHSRKLGEAHLGKKFLYDVYTGEVIQAKSVEEEYTLLTKGYLYGMSAIPYDRSGTTTGTTVINRNDEHKWILIEDLDKFEKEGWELGFSEEYRERHSQNSKGRKWVNNKNIERWASKTQQEALISLGWSYGRIGWKEEIKPSFGRKGGRYMTNEVVNKRVFNLKEEQFLLKDGWRYGKRHSEKYSSSHLGKNSGKIRIENGYEEKVVSLFEFDNYYKSKGFRKGRLTKSNYK